MWDAPSISTDKVVFLTGAGISADSPTNGPLGYDLSKRALSHAFLPEVSEKISDLYAIFGIDRKYPRLEAVLDVASKTHGIEILNDLLSDLRQGKPNDLHVFFNRHLKNGGHHVTANFDTLIENGDESVKVIHFHGNFSSNTNDCTHLGARLSLIEKGFDTATKKCLMGIFEYDADLTMIIIGYSGLDFFDMDPFIQESIQSLKNSISHIIWINHQSDREPQRFEEVNDSNKWPSMFKTFYNAGINCQYVNCRTIDFLNLLAIQWGYPQINSNGRKAFQWSCEHILNEDSKKRATLQLYLHMGMFKDFQQLLISHPELTNLVDYEMQAEIAWQHGQYRAALQHWKNAYCGDDCINIAKRLERTAACCWIRGSFFQAYITAKKALEIALSSKDVDTIALCFEMVGRVLVSMGRSPDVKWFSSLKRRKKIANQINDILLNYKHGTHIKNRLESVLRDLENDPEKMRGKRVTNNTQDSTKPSGSKSFAQYEAFSASLDYQRGEQRRLIAEGAIEMTRDWLDTYILRAEALGKSEGIATALKLPGVSSLFSVKEVKTLLRLIDITWWHRKRFFLNYIFKRFGWLIISLY
jgi:hypothetical protein